MNIHEMKEGRDLGKKEASKYWKKGRSIEGMIKCGGKVGRNEEK